MAEWSEIGEQADCCVTPVLTLDEVPHHPHHQFRSSFLAMDGFPQPVPAPRFSSHVERARGRCREPDVFSRWGADRALIEVFRDASVVERRQ